jgi:hypothetical protein
MTLNCRFGKIDEKTNKHIYSRSKTIPISKNKKKKITHGEFGVDLYNLHMILRI